jgi:hypothetical protein
MAEPDKRPVTMEELLVSSLAQTGCSSEALDREGADYSGRVYAEDFGGTGDVPKTNESDTTVTDHRPLL